MVIVRATEPTGRGSPKDVFDATLVFFLSVGQWRRVIYTSDDTSPLDLLFFIL